MRQVVKRVSLTQPAPIQIDSTEPEVIETALEQIPGRAIVNSVNLEAGRDKLDVVAPLALAHGASADRADHRRGRHGQDGRAQGRDRPAHHGDGLRRARPGARAADLRLPHVHADHRRRGVAAVAPSRRSRASAASRRRSPGVQDLARRLQRLVRRVAARPAPSSTRSSCTTASRPGSTWRWSTRTTSRPTARSPTASATSPTTSSSTAARTRSSASSRTSRPRATSPRQEAADATAGMEPEEALHFHILRRKRDGRRGLDRPLGRQDRRGPDAQRRAAAGHEGGRRQVRRRRADPPLRAPERRGHEARRGPAGAVPRQARGLHEGHGRARHRVRRRPRHRQVARQHDPHQQRLHGRRPRQAGPDPDHHRGGQGA